MNLAIAAERLGDVARAAKHYQAVLSMVPDAPGSEKARTSAREAMARLGRLRSRAGEAAGVGGADPPVKTLAPLEERND
jgi:hypothetical protein